MADAACSCELMVMLIRVILYPKSIAKHIYEKYNTRAPRRERTGDRRARDATGGRDLL